MPDSSRPGAVASPLADLLAHLTDSAQVRDALAEAAGLPARPAYPALPALEELRQLWAQLRTDSQLRESMKPAALDAGPLNSASLVQRALGLMRNTSPGYLRHFIAYLDVLSCLEQMQADGVAGADTATTTTGGKRRRSRARRSG